MTLAMMLAMVPAPWVSCSTRPLSLLPRQLMARALVLRTVSDSREMTDSRYMALGRRTARAGCVVSIMLGEILNGTPFRRHVSMPLPGCYNYMAMPI